MRAGALDRTVTLQRAVVTRNAFGEAAETWSDLVAGLPASRRDVSDAERLRAGETSAVIATRFQIRWAPAWADLNPRDRLVCEGRTYAIVGVKELGRREGLEVSCAARAEV